MTIAKPESETTGMIDLHAHILPGIDDGAGDMGEALEMCRAAAGDGIGTIVATPHSGDGDCRDSRRRTLHAVAELNSRLKEEGIPVSILPGADAYIHERLDVLLAGREVMTVNDNMRYVMVEFPRHVVPPRHAEWMFRLTIAGFTPVLTHPERNTALHGRTEIVRGWVDKGGLVQLTAMSLTGAFGRGTMKCAEDLLRCRLVHAIASDAHSATKRPPILAKAVERASALVGPDYAFDLVKRYPAAIVAGEPVCTPEPIRARPGRIARFFAGARA